MKSIKASSQKKSSGSPPSAIESAVKTVLDTSMGWQKRSFPKDITQGLRERLLAFLATEWTKPLSKPSLIDKPSFTTRPIRAFLWLDHDSTWTLPPTKQEEKSLASLCKTLPDIDYSFTMAETKSVWLWAINTLLTYYPPKQRLLLSGIKRFLVAPLTGQDLSASLRFILDDRIDHSVWRKVFPSLMTTRLQDPQADKWQPAALLWEIMKEVKPVPTALDLTVLLELAFHPDLSEEDTLSFLKGLTNQSSLKGLSPNLLAKGFTSQNKEIRTATMGLAGRIRASSPGLSTSPSI